MTQFWQDTLSSFRRGRQQKGFIEFCSLFLVSCSLSKHYSAEAAQLPVHKYASDSREVKVLH